MLVLAFDTATDVATSALLDGGRGGRGARIGVARGRCSEDRARAAPSRRAPSAGDVGGIAVGTAAPGASRGPRIGLAVARGLALALDVPAAGVSTLDALARGRPGALAGRRREAPRGVRRRTCRRVGRRSSTSYPRGRSAWASGAVRVPRICSRTLGVVVPVDADERHVPRGSAFTRRLATRLRRRPTRSMPIYVRAPDADRLLS